MSAITLHLAQMLEFNGNPMIEGSDSVRHTERGALAVQDGHVIVRGTGDDLRRIYPTAHIVDHGNALLLPGFVDAHVHYPQTAMIASWGKRLIDWLNTYTFPEEMRFDNPDYAADIAGRYLDLALTNGTTTMCSYCTIHPESVTAFFNAAADKGVRVFGGKTCMDRNAPEGLRDTAQSAYDDSKSLMNAWHGKGRASYVITPRFSPTSTPEQLSALGAHFGRNTRSA